jgi:hypothetical protein
MIQGANLSLPAHLMQLLQGCDGREATLRGGCSIRIAVSCWCHCCLCSAA